MANNEKISGKLTGNKLNISISTNSTGNGQNANTTGPIKQIESTASKVKSISEISAKNIEQQDKSLNKKQIIDDKNQATSDIQEIQILKSIEQKLQDLNNNVIKIQSLKDTDDKKSNASPNVKEREKNIFDAKFIEGTNKSFIELFKNSTFKTQLRMVLNDIYDNSSLLKLSDLDSFKADISDLISSSAYTIPDNEKAVNPEKQVSLTSESIKAINQEAKEGNEAIESGSAAQIEKIGESIKSFTEKAEASIALNTNTSDQQQNNINDMLQQAAAEQAKTQNELINEVKKNIDEKAVENDNVDDKKEVGSLNDQSEKKLTEVEQTEKGRPEAEDDKANENISDKLDEVKDDLVEHKESIDALLDEIKASNDLKVEEKEERKVMRDERKVMKDEKRKMMAEKVNKSSSLLGIIRNSLTSASTSIKNVGKSLAISKPISKVRSLFNKEPNKELASKKTNTLKVVDQKSSPEKDKKFEGIDDKERNRTTPITLGKTQKTVSGKDSLTPLREVGKNSESFLMGQGMKKMGSLNDGEKKGSLKELLKISTLLSGFLTFYKKSAKDAEARELYKLRFGSEKKSEDTAWDKFLGFFKPKKDKDKKSEAKETGDAGWGIIGSIIGLIFTGLKFFGKQIGKWALKGIWSLTKLIGKGLWKLVSWVGKLAWKGISWAIGKLGGLIGKLFKFLWGKISSIIGKVLGKIGNVLSKLGGKLVGAFKNVFGKVFGKAAQLISKIFGKLGGVFGKIFNGIFGKLGNIFGKFKGMFGKFGGVLKNLTGKVGQMAGKIGKAAKGLAKGAGKAVQGITKNAGKLIKGAGKGIKSAGSFIGKMGKGLAKPFGKLLSKGGGKAAAKVATKGLAKLGLKAGLRAGAGALKAIPGLGLIATAGMAAFDAVDGWKNAASITGKKESELTWKDKTKAAGASVLSGLTFGLVSSQTMYKGINAVGNFAKKAWKYTPMGLAASGAKKAWNWLTKPSKTVDPKTGKVVQGKTGLQKIGDAGKAGLKAIGSIGKTLFKFTPMGMALSAAKGVAGLLKPKDKGITFNEKQFTELKSLISGVKGTTALAAKKSNVSKFISPLQKLRKGTISAFGKIEEKLRNPSNIVLKVLSKHPLINASLKAVDKIRAAETKKFAAEEKKKEKEELKEDKKDKQYGLMPQLIKNGIASYFDKHKLKIDVKTGDVEVMPLGAPDAASKV